MAHGTPCVSLTVSFSSVRQLLASPATSWPMPCGKGPSRPTNHAKKWEFMLLLLVTPLEGSIIWFGMEFVIAEDTDTCYLHIMNMSYVCISLQCFDLIMEDIMDYIPYFLITACSTAPQIDRPRLSKKTARQICSLPEWTMTAPVFISWWMSQMQCLHKNVVWCAPVTSVSNRFEGLFGQ